MKNLSNYLFFNGQCKAAMEFYQKALGGELRIVTAAMTGQEAFKDLDPNTVMNAFLKSGNISFMASDNMKRDTVVGDSVCLYLDCSSQAEVDKLYGALAQGGTADMKPQEHFWGAYMGSLTDAYGIGWMVNYSEE